MIIFFTAAYGLTAELRTVQETALEFGRKEWAPNMARWDENVSLNRVAP